MAQGKQVGTGFTNLQDILKLNANNRLGSTISSGITNTAQQARDKLAQSQGQFKQSLDTTNQGIQGSKQFGEGLINEGDKTGNVSNDDSKKFIDFQHSQYQGPVGLSNLDQISNQANQAQNLGQMTGSQGGRLELLRRYATPGSSQGYTSSRQNLDELYLGGAQNQLNQAKRQTIGLGTQAQNAGNTAEAQAQGARQGLVGAQKDLSTLLGNKYGAAQTALDSETQAARDNYNTQYGALADQTFDKTKGPLASSLPTSPDSPYNVVNQDSDAYYGYNPYSSQFFTKSEDPNKSNVASDSERARIAALSRLSEQQNPLDPNAPQYDPSKFYNFDQTSFQNAANQARDSYNQAAQPNFDFKNGTVFTSTANGPFGIKITRNYTLADVAADPQKRATAMPNLMNNLNQLNVQRQQRNMSPLSFAQLYGFNP